LKSCTSQTYKKAFTNQKSFACLNIKNTDKRKNAFVFPQLNKACEDEL
jgi:hypothetical protein